VKPSATKTKGGKNAKNSGTHSIDGGGLGPGLNPFFINKKIKYVWDPSLMMFTKLKPLDSDMRQRDFHRSVSPKYTLELCQY
jgi:hypothetical protein